MIGKISFTPRQVATLIDQNVEFIQLEDGKIWDSGVDLFGTFLGYIGDADAAAELIEAMIVDGYYLDEDHQFLYIWAPPTCERIN